MNLRRSIRKTLTALGLGWPAWELTQHIEPTPGTRQMLIYLAIFLPTWFALNLWLAWEPKATTESSEAEQ